MTTNLTPCPDCGKPSNNGRICRLCESEDAMHEALTQRPAAQTERDILNDSAWIAGAKFGWNCGVEGTRDLLNQCIEQRIKDRVEARASLPASQQATPEPVGEPVYMTASAFVDGQPYTWREVSKALYDSQPEKWRRILYARPAPGVPEDVQRDAERYRFIRDANRSDCITRGISLHTMESLDEYVDAAMEDETAALAAAQAKQ